jgi:hypothetical protein
MDSEPVNKTFSENVSDDNLCNIHCMQKTANELKVYDAIKILIAADEVNNSYITDIRFAYRPAIQKERTTGIFVLLEWLKGTIVLSLKTPKQDETAGQNVKVSESQNNKTERPAIQNTEQDTTAKEPDNTSMPDKSEIQKPRKPLAPAPFVISASLTAGFAIAWGVTDIIVYTNKKKLEDLSNHYNNWQSDMNKTKNIQIAARVLMACTITGAVTTTILGFFTNFKNRPANSHIKTSKMGYAAPFAVKNGGGLMVGGRF